MQRDLRRWRARSALDPGLYHLAELETVRATGYAVNDEETDSGVRFVGVRIDVASGKPAPALVLGAPKYRLPRDEYPRIAAILGEAARRIAAIVA